MTSAEKFQWWKDLDAYWQRYFKIMLDYNFNFDRQAREQFTPDEKDLDVLLNQEDLQITNSSISTFKPLVPLKKLRSLFCDGMPFLTSLEDLPLLQQLTAFRVAGSKITSLAPLAHMKNLLSLELHDNMIVNLEGLEELRQLTKLSLKEPHVSDLTLLTNFINLEELNISDMPAADLNTLTGLENLKSLTLFRMSAPSFLFLKSLKSLETLLSFRLAINSPQEMPSMPTLTTLDLSDCVMEDLSPLKSLTNLRSLNITNTNAKTILPLAANKNLVELYLNEEKFSVDEVKQLRQAIPQCTVYSERGKNFPFSKYSLYELVQDVEYGHGNSETIKKGSKVIFTGYTYNHYDSISMYYFKDLATHETFVWTIHNQETKEVKDLFIKVG